MFNKEKIILNVETINAIFIIVLISVFILANLFAGFILSLFAVVIAVSMFLAFCYPRSGIYAVIFLTFIFERFFTLQPIIFGRDEYKLYPIDFILGAVILGIIWKMINIKCHSNHPEFSRFAQDEKIIKKEDYLFIVFILLSGIYFLASVLFTQSEFNLAFSSFKNYSFYSLFYFVIIILFQSKEHILRLFKFALAGGVAIIFFILWGIFTGTGLWSEYTPLSTEGVRLLAFTHGFYLCLAFIGLVAYYTHKLNDYTLNTVRSEVYKNLNWYLILIFIWSAGIIESMMRHLWVALFFSLIAIFVLSAKKTRDNYRKLIIKYIVGISLLIILVWYLGILFPYSTFHEVSNSAQNVISERLGSLGNVSTDESFSWRNVVWRQAYNEYINHPVTGIGFGKYVSVESGTYRDYVEVRNIHNSPLIVLVQMGIIGIAIFGLVVYFIGKKLLFKREKSWIDISTITLLIFYLGVFMFQPYLETNLLGIFFWMILGLARILGNTRNQNCHSGLPARQAGGEPESN